MDSVKVASVQALHGDQGILVLTAQAYYYCLYVFSTFTSSPTITLSVSGVFGERDFHLQSLGVSFTSTHRLQAVM